MLNVCVFSFSTWKQTLVEKKRGCDKKKLKGSALGRSLSIIAVRVLKSSSSSGKLTRLKQFNSHNSENSKRSNKMFYKQPRKKVESLYQKNQGRGQKIGTLGKIRQYISQKSSA